MIFPELRPPNLPYIGDSDLDTLSWLQQFCRTVGEDVAHYGISPQELAEVTAATEAFGAALMSVLAEPTPAGTCRKNEARAVAESLGGRRLAQRVKLNPNLSRSQMVAIGLRLPAKRRKRIARPRTMPTLSMVGMSNGVHTLRFSDVAAFRTSSRKPPDVTHMLLFAEIATELTGTDDSLRLLAAVTRSPFRVNFDYRQHAGKMVRYRARWLTARGKMGPWSAELRLIVPLPLPTPAELAARQSAEEQTQSKAPVVRQSAPRKAAA